MIFDDKLTNFSEKTLSIYISKKIVECECPSCKYKTKRIHNHRFQKIKNNQINGYHTYLYLKKTRLLCTHCGKKFYMNYNDIVNPKFRCSTQLFNNIINQLQNTSMTIKDVAKSNNVSRYLHFFAYLMQWENITSLPKHIGIDEFKGNCDNSKYLFHIYDLDTKKTITILRTRKNNDLLDFFDSIENRNDVELVTMDLYNSFRKAIKAKLKHTTIVADRFHYTRIIANALYKLRLNIWRNLKKYFNSLKLSLLKYIAKVPKDKLLTHEEKLNYSFELSSELKYGYQLYQSFLRIKDANSYKEKAKLFKEWLSDASTSTLKTFKTASESL